MFNCGDNTHRDRLFRTIPCLALPHLPYERSVGFASALSLALHHHPCHMNALFVSHPHYPSKIANALASLVKGRWLDGKPQTVTLLRLLAICLPFLYCILFRRQDGGIASPPTLNRPSLAKSELLSPSKIRATTLSLSPTPPLTIPQ